MKDLIQRSYEAIRKRGLITDDTTIEDFDDKIVEEYEESCYEFYKLQSGLNCQESYIEELTDLATACFMAIKHLGYDPIAEFEKVVIKNEKRKD